MSEREWKPIETAPKDGTLIDVWCVPPEESEFESRGIRLTDVAWHEADEILDRDGWIRVTDDGDWDIVDSEPMCQFGLPRWVPTHWMERPSPPSHIPLSLSVSLSV